MHSVFTYIDISFIVVRSKDRTVVDEPSGEVQNCKGFVFCILLIGLIPFGEWLSIM